MPLLLTVFHVSNVLVAVRTVYNVSETIHGPSLPHVIMLEVVIEEDPCVIVVEKVTVLVMSLASECDDCELLESDTL